MHAYDLAHPPPFLYLIGTHRPLEAAKAAEGSGSSWGHGAQMQGDVCLQCQTWRVQGCGSAFAPLHPTITTAAARAPLCSPSVMWGGTAARGRCRAAAHVQVTLLLPLLCSLSCTGCVCSLLLSLVALLLLLPLLHHIVVSPPTGCTSPPPSCYTLCI